MRARPRIPSSRSINPNIHAYCAVFALIPSKSRKLQLERMRYRESESHYSWVQSSWVDGKNRVFCHVCMQPVWSFRHAKETVGGKMRVCSMALPPPLLARHKFQSILRLGHCSLFSSRNCRRDSKGEDMTSRECCIEKTRERARYHSFWYMICAYSTQVSSFERKALQ